ncbi:hypothetical protein [Leucobacter sp. GX24907]
MNEQIRRPDHESDPAHNVELGQDWSDEGGATAWGPATHPTVLPINDTDGAGSGGADSGGVDSDGVSAEAVVEG